MRLGLEPTPVAMETTATTATLRLRLAADDQLAAHTPRPRAPADALFSLQVHESTLNNAFGRLGLAGRRLSLEELSRMLCERRVRAAHSRRPARGGERNVRPSPAAAGGVPRRPRAHAGGARRDRERPPKLVRHRRPGRLQAGRHGPQVFLEREGPVQLSGPGHQGRMEFALRTIFGKIFPKERPMPLVPERVVKNPRLAGLAGLQAVSTDGWLALALGPPPRGAGTKSSATAARPHDGPQRLLRR